jgi:hypothetical protein
MPDGGPFVEYPREQREWILQRCGRRRFGNVSCEHHRLVGTIEIATLLPPQHPDTYILVSAATQRGETFGNKNSTHDEAQ